ncbi:hypothetical protein [Mycobacterium intracellulare]|uniref:hypothetical protein n=1 Tax=Mycobacterium intracellulare TaxID=1767 RepID=UPI001EEE7C65|nr:hypothetical protein [Mycobacterium intracellulare]MEE3755258.1 hypothetical protein [Mycobacterium intracellulare]
MGTLDIATREVIVAYGGSSSSWAASTINTWLGVIAAVLVLANGYRIVHDKQKEESQKIKDVAFMSIAAVIVVGVAMMFINNKFGNAAGHVSDLGN